VLDAIVIPSQNISIGRGLSSVSNICEIFSKKIEGFLQKRKPVNDKRFMGVILNQTLPYHYFYDCLPGYYWLMEGARDRLDKYPVASFKCGGYLAVSEIFSIGQGDLCLGSLGKGEIFTSSAGYYLSPLRNEKYRRHRIIERLDDFLSGLKAVRDSAEQCRTEGLVVWIGILSGKRKWVEQAAAIVALVKVLESTGKIGCYVFDGMTSTIFSDERRVDEQHQKVIEEIVSGAKIPVEKVVNLHGARSQEKMRWAAATDYFLSDAATSSLYVSRVFGKPGVIHALSKSRIKGHIHKRAKPVPDELIVDLNPGEDWQYSNYSIPVESFVNFVMQDMREHGFFKVEEVK